MGQKGVLRTCIKVSKDMLRIYGIKGLINMLVGKYMYRTKQGYIQDIFIQNTFCAYRTYFYRTHWTRTGLYRTNTRHHTYLTNTFWTRTRARKSFGVDRAQGKWPKCGIRKLTTHITKGIWADRSFIGKALGH